DLPGARKFCGFRSFKHTVFCNLCWCQKYTTVTKPDGTEEIVKTGYNDFDTENWRPRTNDECRHWATKWFDASKQDAKAYFQTSAIRWSELLRLPYFDPTRMIVVDPMHNLLLG
ncbi:hypothetical protein K435DRAFT_639128, partial [Dendrothele bispora CBS 962.96]